MLRLAVLASGVGSIFEAMVKSGLPVELLLADRPCRALEVAEENGVAHALVDRRDYGFAPRTQWDRKGFTKAIMAELKRHDIGLIAMSGFMTVFDPVIYTKYQDRILNTHPSLLPAFKGEGGKVMRDTLAAGVTETGCTVHISNAEIDDGRILTQQRVPVLPGDTPDSLWERIKAVERRLYPATIRKYSDELSSRK
jgi:phosphoribosylglycinamide formyltransferase-1